MTAYSVGRRTDPHESHEVFRQAPFDLVMMLTASIACKAAVAGILEAKSKPEADGGGRIMRLRGQAALFIEHNTYIFFSLYCCFAAWLCRMHFIAAYTCAKGQVQGPDLCRLYFL